MNWDQAWTLTQAERRAYIYQIQMQNGGNVDFETGEVTRKK
jgi:hypothetical protein